MVYNSKLKILENLSEVSSKKYDFAISMLPTRTELNEVYFGDLNLAKQLSQDCMVIDCSTISPLDALEFGKKIKQDFGIQFLDAPVAGGVSGAKDASLTFMVGSESPNIFEVCLTSLY
jgi:3-hydroxyisobutyrate dehydrogenase-like beta-hydroxyacid dehydrogenase